MFDINREHPEYRARKEVWQQYRDLYAGGEQFKLNAQRYLIRRQKEPGDVYAERLSRVFYENYVGSIVDWYAATLFRREPVLTFDGTNERGQAFFGEFMEDCDRKGTALSGFLPEAVRRRRWWRARATCWWTFRGWRSRPGTGRRKTRVGASRAYLVDYSAEDLINWSYDEQGNYEWVVLRTKSLKQDRRGGCGVAARDALGVLRQAEFPDLRAGRGRATGRAGRADRRRAARAGEAAAGAAVRAANSGRAVADEPGGVCCSWSTSINRMRCRGR